MGDVSRTFDELKAQLYGQGVTGDPLNELSMRDLIESIFQYGGLRLPASQFVGGNSQTIGTAFICLTQFILPNISSSDVVPNEIDGNIKILRPGVFQVNVDLSFTGTNNTVFEGNLIRKRVSEPDEELDICTFVETIRPNLELSNAGGMDPLLVEADDILEYSVKADAAGKDFELRSGQFNVFRIG